MVNSTNFCPSNLKAQRVKKRHKHFLIAFIVGYLGSTCLMIYAMYTRGLEANLARLLVFPVVMGVLFALAVSQTKVWDRLRRREREAFRNRGWNWKAYRVTLFIIAVLVACVLAARGFGQESSQQVLAIQ